MAAVRLPRASGSTPTSVTAGLSARIDGADAGEQAAAADGHDDRVDVGRLLEDLERHRALAGHHVGVVERMDEREPVALRELPACAARLGQVGAVQHHAWRRACDSW